MNFFSKVSKFLFIVCFLVSTLFANEDEMIITPPGQETKQQEDTLENTPSEDKDRNQNPDKEEILDEEIAPTPPPALIDLDNQKKSQDDSTIKYSGLYLFVFNLTMFTAGLIIVKNITGQRV